MPNKKKTQLRLLAQKFLEPGRKNEKSIADEIFRTSEHDQTYVRLRSQLKRRLVGLLFHLDIRTGSELRKQTYRSAQDVFVIRVLLMLEARIVATWLLPRALDRARKYELTQDLIELLQVVRRNATLNGDRKRFAEISLELEEARAVRAAEIRLQDLNERISVELATTANPSVETISFSQRTFPEVERLYKRFPTFNVSLLYYRLGTFCSELTSDYSWTYALCDEADAFLSKYPEHGSPLHRGQFAIKRLTSSFSIRNREGFLSALAACEEAFPIGNNNWFLWKEMEVVYSFHEEKWEKASTTYTEIISHSRFDSQPESVRQKWTMYHLYLDFFSMIEAGGEPKAQHFSRLLKNVPIYKKDKAGYNAALIILQCLVLARRGNLNGLIGQCDVIRKYIDRYMRKQHHKQLFGFFRTILLLVKYDFDVAKTEIKAAKYIAQMKRYGHEKVDQGQTVRFELSWFYISRGVERAVERAKEKKKKVKKLHL
ncbi:MAG TPA: hypothetical protein VGM92_03300 [Candidatus Kapabacteria bacterium]